MKERDWKKTKKVNTTGREEDHETVKLVGKEGPKNILTELDKRGAEGFGRTIKDFRQS